ncbi:MAG TPA: TadE/TadG family type IV pilus assembly protein [Candidatus Limnocylindrales bacterium]
MIRGRGRATARLWRRATGQGLVEFALGITIFLTILIGLVDLARAAFLFNGVSDAAREIARVTSVHPGSTGLGTSSETSTAVSNERVLVPGLTVQSYTCIDLAGAAVSGTCQPGNWVKVAVRTSFQPILPLLSAFGPISFSTASSAKIQ